MFTLIGLVSRALYREYFGPTKTQAALGNPFLAPEGILWEWLGVASARAGAQRAISQDFIGTRSCRHQKRQKNGEHGPRLDTMELYATSKRDRSRPLEI
jgi:hypothetical protein